MANQKYTQIILSFLISIALFGAGFYVGNKDKVNTQNTKFLNASTTEYVDLAPFWKAWKLLEEKYTASSSTEPIISNEDKLWGAISGLANSYGDPYTVFFPPVESKMFEEEISGSFGGVGMEIGIADGLLTVIAPLKNTPAERAGVLAGDKIVEIDGKSSINMTTDEAITLIRGERGTKVTITFMRKDAREPITKEIIRANIEIPTVDTKITDEGVFVIELYNFSATSPNLFRTALREFVESGLDKLVLDLRNNPGGYLEASLDMASWFLPTGRVVVIEDFGGKRNNREYRSKGYNIFSRDLKMAILVNEGSASASEILAGALREHGRAVLVGRQTFGKGSVQELVPVTNATSLKITVAHWLTPLGNSISDGGLTPDIIVSKEDEKDGIDVILQTAIDYFLEI